jgi:IS5 family transposase
LLVALYYLKYTFDLSDEDIVAVWVENPYWQHFSGNQYFEHTVLIDSSVMNRFRKRIGARVKQGFAGSTNLSRF